MTRNPQIRLTAPAGKLKSIHRGQSHFSGCEIFELNESVTSASIGLWEAGVRRDHRGYVKRPTYMRLHGHLDKSQLPERLKDLPDIVSGEVVVEITDIKPMIRDGGVCIPFVAKHGFRSRRQARNERARGRQGPRSVGVINQL